MSKSTIFNNKETVIIIEHGIKQIGTIISSNKNHSKYVVRTARGSFKILAHNIQRFSLNKTLTKMEKEQQN